VGQPQSKATKSKLVLKLQDN